MLLCTLSARRSGKSAAGALSPADYIRLRREAAGLSRYDVALRLPSIGVRTDAGDHRARPIARDLDDALGLVRQLETPGIRARHRMMVEALGSIFPLDVDVYFQLADAPPQRHPSVCRSCGCSDQDPCSGGDGVCTWATPGMCTRCLGSLVAAAEAA